MSVWNNTNRCTRCLDVIEPGKVHECRPDDVRMASAMKPIRAYCDRCNKSVSGLTPHHCGPEDDTPSASAPPSDPATLRAMAERWFGSGVRAGDVSVSRALSRAADAMEEAE